jgi:benzylsuccinate synthase
MAVKARSLDMKLEMGTANACKKCKWGIEDPTDPSKGQCVVGRTAQGGIWKRLIHDYFNTTCDKFEEGELSFRDHV